MQLGTRRLSLHANSKGARTTTITQTSEQVATLKLAHRATWAAGDYPAVARHIADGPVKAVLAAAHVRPGARILDVATGSGKIMGRYLPAPPRFASAPPLWGHEPHVRQLFARHNVTLSFERATNLFAFESIDAYQTFFEEHYGPTIKAQDKLAPEGRWDDCRAELRELYERSNTATDGSCRIEAEYVAISIGR